MRVFSSPHLRLVFVLLIVAYLFAPTLAHDFSSWDDEGHILQNSHIRSLSPTNINAIFHSELNGTYVPLTVLSFAIEYYFFEYKPFIYHLDNLLLHLGVVTLIYFLTLRLGYSLMVATLAALLFGIHPMHVESVAWVTERKDVLYSFFYVFALLLYLEYAKTRRISLYVWALLCGVLSILAKPMALSLPLILLLFDWFLKRRWSFGLLLEKVPFVFLIFPVAWWTYTMNVRAVDLDVLQAPLIWVWSLVFYISKFIVPTDLSVIYQLPQPVSLVNPVFLFAIGLCLLVLFILIRFRNQRLLVFAFGYFFLSIFFLLRTFDVTKNLGPNIVADRFMYLPSLGICIWFGFCMEWMLNVWGRKRREFRYLVLMGVALVFLTLGVIAYGQVKTWGDERLFWSKVIQQHPTGFAYNQLGNYYLDRKDYPHALICYERAIAIEPRYNKPYSNRGMILFYLGRYHEAIANFTKAIALFPADANVAYNNRGYAYWLLGDRINALKDYNEAIKLYSGYLPVYLNRAAVFKENNDYINALADYKHVLNLDPDNDNATHNIQILEKMIHEPGHKLDL